MNRFRALVAEQNAAGNYDVALKELSNEELPPGGDVVVDIAFSSLNYKDALAVTGRGKIIRKFPMVPGIDLAGTVVESTDSRYQPGDRVIGLAHGLGELHWGGYAERQRVRGDVLVPLPRTLSLEDSMRIGTAGFTAMLCVLALEHAGIVPSEREVVVTGAAGGVGSLAVMLLAKRGFRVAASTGRAELEPYLRELGASSIIARDDLAKKGGALQSEKWAGAIDTVGGQTLATLLAQTVYEGAIAACGMAGGAELNTTVFPLILRNVSLLGVSSIETSMPKRLEAWSRLESDLDREKLASLSRTEPLSKIAELSDEILAGQVRGRIVINVHD
jgi:acrylyl-CoA reductase (NADPH)